MYANIRRIRRNRIAELIEEATVVGTRAALDAVNAYSSPEAVRKTATQAAHLARRASALRGKGRSYK